MELNELKSTWQNAGGASKSEADLQRMTKITNHPSLKKIRTKLIIETIGLSLFLVINNDWFDGGTKPFYLNVLLTVSVLLYILNDVVGYISIASPIRGTNLKISIRNYSSRIRRLFVLSLVISFLYGISIIIFFASVISFSKEKYLILAGIITVLLSMTYFSFRIWSNWIKSLQQQIREFDFDEEK